jgi:hypothetical protein
MRLHAFLAQQIFAKNPAITKEFNIVKCSRSPHKIHGLCKLAKDTYNNAALT